MPHSKQKLRRRGIILSGIVGVVVTVLLLIPISGPDTSSSAIGIDKAVHFLFFFALVVPVLTFYPRAWVWVVPVAIAYGGMIEVIQPYFGRGMELGDFVANSLGVVSAVPVSRWAHKRWLKPRQVRKREGAKRDD